MLFLQKWDEDKKSPTYNPPLDNYSIFFATSEYGGKDNSGEYIFLKNTDGEKLSDLFGHEIVNQDLFDVRRVLQQQLERLRKRDAANTQLIAAHEARLNEIYKHLPQRPTIAEVFEQFARKQNFSFASEENE